MTISKNEQKSLALQDVYLIHLPMLGAAVDYTYRALQDTVVYKNIQMSAWQQWHGQCHRLVATRSLQR